MAQVKVTVNGRPVEMWIDEEETCEIQDFYRSEMRGFAKTCRRPVISRQAIKNTTRAIQAGNNSIRFA